MKVPSSACISFTITITLVCYVHLAPASDRIVALTRPHSIIPRCRGNQYSWRQITLLDAYSSKRGWRQQYFFYRFQPVYVVIQLRDNRIFYFIYDRSHRKVNEEIKANF